MRRSVAGLTLALVAAVLAPQKAAAQSPYEVILRRFSQSSLPIDPHGLPAWGENHPAWECLAATPENPRELTPARLGTLPADTGGGPLFAKAPPRVVLSPFMPGRFASLESWKHLSSEQRNDGLFILLEDEKQQVSALLRSDGLYIFFAGKEERYRKAQAGSKISGGIWDRKLFVGYCFQRRGDI